MSLVLEVKWDAKICRDCVATSQWELLWTPLQSRVWKGWDFGAERIHRGSVLRHWQSCLETGKRVSVTLLILCLVCVCVWHGLIGNSELLMALLCSVRASVCYLNSGVFRVVFYHWVRRAYADFIILNGLLYKLLMVTLFFYVEEIKHMVSCC